MDRGVSRAQKEWTEECTEEWQNCEVRKKEREVIRCAKRKERIDKRVQMCRGKKGKKGEKGKK